MIMTVIGWALGAIFIGFVGVAVYRLSSFIPMRPREPREPKEPKKQEESKPYDKGGK